MEETVLKVKNLNVISRGEKIIENLSFEVRKGDVFCLLGPNGAGKTTIFRALLNLIPYQGEIEWKEGIKIGYLPERISKMDFKRIPMTVYDFFKIKEKNKEKIRKILADLNLKKDNILEENPGNLSAGEFQRFLIGWVLISSPDVLLLDEPTTNIDVSGENFLLNFLEKFRQEHKLTIILITHDLDIVYGFSSKVLCLYKKQLCSGIPREVLTPDILERLYGTKIKFYQHHHD